MLLDYNADPNRRINPYFPLAMFREPDLEANGAALHCVVSCANYFPEGEQIFKILLDNGADVNMTVAACLI